MNRVRIAMRQLWAYATHPGPVRGVVYGLGASAVIAIAAVTLFGWYAAALLFGVSVGFVMGMAMAVEMSPQEPTE